MLRLHPLADLRQPTCLCVRADPPMQRSGFLTAPVLELTVTRYIGAKPLFPDVPLLTSAGVEPCGPCAVSHIRAIVSVASFVYRRTGATLLLRGFPHRPGRIRRW